MRISRKHIPDHLIPWIFFLLAAYFPLFLHLDSQPLKNFDESFYGLRAYHLATTGQYLNNYLELPDGPSGTNLKAPFFSGIQALAFHILGFNELAMRLPVALCVLWLLIYIVRFALKEWNDPYMAFFSAAVLLTSWGFINVHVSRTGDHDAPLTVFSFLALLNFYRYLKNDRTEKKYLWWTTTFLLLAVFTKSIAGLFFLPAYLLYALYKRQLLPLLKEKESWWAIGTALLFIILYYAYREWDYPGFIRQLWLGELGGHYGQTRNGHAHPFGLYLNRLIAFKYSWWLPFVPLGLALSFFKGCRPYRDLSLLLLFAWLSCFLVISTSQTKLEWYDAPLYPLMAVWVGLVLSIFFQGMLHKVKPSKPILIATLIGLFGLIFFVKPYQDIIQKVYQPKDNDNPGEMYGYLMHQVARTHPDLQSYGLVYKGYSFHCLFYQLVYNQQKDYQISRKRSFDEMQVGETVMLCQPEGIAFAESHFEIDYLSAGHGCRLLRLTALKKP